MTLVLAVDQGTTNTKVIAIDELGRARASSTVPMRVSYPRPGWAEQSATDIWDSVAAGIAEVARSVTQVDAIAISNQRESIVVWEAASGRPIAPCIIWQCRRSADRCEAIRSAGHAEAIADRTGLPLDPLFPAAKIAWILDEVPDARRRASAGELRAGTIDSWLLWNLTGGAIHATDHSNASRTQLFSTRSLAWDAHLGDIFDVPLGLLPEVRPSDSHFGDVVSGATALPGGVPIRAMLGDSHAALFGHGISTPGAVKATYGTGSSLMTLTDKPVRSSHGLAGTVAWSTTSDGVAHALEGNIAVSGQAAEYASTMLGLANAEALSRLAETVDDANGVVFVPALVGLGAPYWRDDVLGTLNGLSLGTRPAHIARAALEAIAYQVADVYRAMESDLQTKLADLSVDGGASRNDLLMQMQADVLQQRVVRGDVAELSAMGAARMTGLVSPPHGGQPRTTFEPQPGSAIERGTSLWRTAIQRLLA